MSFDTDDIDQAFERFETLIREDPLLARELEESAHVFFARGFDPRLYAQDDLARRRHLEWFLLERVSPGIQGMAIERLAERLPADSGGDALARLLVTSHAGVFEVTGVDAGSGVWMRDLASQGEYPVIEPRASAVLERGDLIAGRLFPIGDGLHGVSRAAAFFRNSNLLEALRADLARAREGRRGSLRVSQSEIETMFYGKDMGQAPADPVGEARALLLEGGVERGRVDEWFEVLADVPFERTKILLGADDVLGTILDELAFESGVDLEAARRALIHAWESLSTKGPGIGASLKPAAAPRSSRDPDGDIARLIAKLEDNRKSGAPLGPVLEELESTLEHEPDGEAADGADLAAPDFPGVVGAMIDEFLWETGRESGAARESELERVKSFGRFAQNVGVFENLGVSDLLAYTCWWLEEHDELRNADEARAQLAALQAFCRWAEDVHEVPLFTAFKAHFSALASSLPRIVEANRRRTRTADRVQGELYEIVNVEGSASVVRDRRGNETDAEIEPSLAEWLRPEDRVRARRLDDGRLAVYCCFPPEARELERK
jgi:hypothetical protein